VATVASSNEFTVAAYGTSENHGSVAPVSGSNRLALIIIQWERASGGSGFQVDDDGLVWSGVEATPLHFTTNPDIPSTAFRTGVQVFAVEEANYPGSAGDLTLASAVSLGPNDLHTCIVQMTGAKQADLTRLAAEIAASREKLLIWDSIVATSEDDPVLFATQTNGQNRTYTPATGWTTRGDSTDTEFTAYTWTREPGASGTYGHSPSYVGGSNAVVQTLTWHVQSAAAPTGESGAASAALSLGTSSIADVRTNAATTSALTIAASATADPRTQADSTVALSFGVSSVAAAGTVVLASAALSLGASSTAVVPSIADSTVALSLGVESAATDGSVVTTQWGGPNQDTPNSFAVNNLWRLMGGLSHDVAGQVLQSVTVHLGGTGNVQVMVLTGGALDDPSSATVLEDLGIVAISGAAEYVIPTATAPMIPRNAPLWIGVKGESAESSGVRFRYVNNSNTTTDFQTARGRADILGATGINDISAAVPSPLGGSSAFSPFWYKYFLTYTLAAAADASFGLTLGVTSTAGNLGVLGTVLCPAVFAAPRLTPQVTAAVRLTPLVSTAPRYVPVASSAMRLLPRVYLFSNCGDLMAIAPNIFGDNDANVGASDLPSGLTVEWGIVADVIPGTAVLLDSIHVDVSGTMTEVGTKPQWMIALGVPDSPTGVYYEDTLEGSAITARLLPTYASATVSLVVRSGSDVRVYGNTEVLTARLANA